MSYHDFEELNDYEKELLEDETDPVYYKLYLTRNKKYCVACMQSFDEYDYDQDDFIKNENDVAYRFRKERNARKFLNKIVKPEYIEEDDLIANNEHMFKLPKEEW